MLVVFHQFKQWVYTHLHLSYRPKRVGPQTRCVVRRPVVGWDIGHDHIYHLYGAERQVWEVSDPLIQAPPTLQVSIVQEVIEETWEWEWEESTDDSWVKLMHCFDTAEGFEM